MEENKMCEDCGCEDETESNEEEDWE